MIQLRPYQTDTEAALREGYRTNLRQIMCLPTGSGKTIVFSSIISKTVQRGKTVLCLSDRTEIFHQTLKAISNHEIPVCKIDRDNKYVYPNAKVFLAMCETFKRRAEQLLPILLPVVDLIIVDECHKKAFDPIIQMFPEVHVLGCSATPTPTKLYTNLVHLIDVPELVQQGYLVPCRAYEVQDNLSDIKVKRNGDYDEASHFAHYNKSKMYDGVIENYSAKCAERSTIVYNVSIEHSELMTKAFNEAGIRSYSITSKTSTQEREWILKEFSAGAFPVLNNCGCLTTGTDIPRCSAIIINRAISVLTLYVQIVGRGARLCPEISKTDFVCIDHGLNHTRFGLWCENRTWSLDPPKKRKAVGPAPVKSCPACTAMLATTARTCQYCGYVFAPTEKELAEGRLVELTNTIRSAIPGKYISQCTIPELIELERTGAVKTTYVWRVLRSRGEVHITEYARIKDYRAAWVNRQLEAMEAEGQTKFADKKINEVELLKIM